MKFEKGALVAKIGRGSEQAMIRLPDGMRDRIKAAADRNGRSMNAEIVRALELAFPEPFSVSARLEELHHLFSALSKVRGYGAAVEVLTDEILGTIATAAAGRDPTLDEASIADLKKALATWHLLREKEVAARRQAVDEKYSSTIEED